MNRFNWRQFVFFILFFSLSINSFAEESISDTLLHERIECIQNMLKQSKTGVNVWWKGWIAGYSVATVGQGAVFLLSKDVATRQDMALGSITTLLGGAEQLLMPLNTGDTNSLDQMPENSTEDKLNKLSSAEKLLETLATKEKAGRSWQVHALSGVVNVSSGLITWIGFKRSVWDGVGNFLLNTAICEAQIWTQPTRTMKDYQKYCKKYKSTPNALAYKLQPEYFISTYPGGIALRIIF